MDDFRQVIDLSQVTSDDTLLLARTAAEAIRGLNWLTGCEAGLGQPPAAYDVIGALALAASRLHQALARPPFGGPPRNPTSGITALAHHGWLAAKRCSGYGCVMRVLGSQRFARRFSCPREPVFLAAALERVVPVPGYLVPEETHRLVITVHRVIALVPGDHAGKPSSLLGDGKLQPYMISVFTCFSFARSRFLSVTRRTQNRPRLVTAQMCVNPRNENVCGFPCPEPFS